MTIDSNLLLLSDLINQFRVFTEFRMESSSHRLQKCVLYALHGFASIAAWTELANCFAEVVCHRAVRADPNLIHAVHVAHNLRMVSGDFVAVQALQANVNAMRAFAYKTRRS